MSVADSTTMDRGARRIPKRTRITWIGCVAVLYLGGCGTTPAPVVEQGRTQVVSAPEIITSNRSSDQDLSRDLSEGANRSRPTVSSSSSPVYSSGGSSRAQVSTPNVTTGGESRISRAPIGSNSVSNRSGTRARSGSSASNSGLPGINPGTHMVSVGDTLFSIAFQYDLDFRDLALANGLTPPYTIFVGQELDLPRKLAGTLVDAATDVAGRVINNNNASSSAIANSTAGIGQSGSISWRWPHPGSVARGFNERGEGIDISGNVGDPVLAAGSGDVVYSGRGVQGTGNLIIIRHSDRLLSAYAHNSAMLVAEGQHIEAGQQIAEVGVNNSGTPMLHFEIRRDGQSVDPMQYLPHR